MATTSTASLLPWGELSYRHCHWPGGRRVAVHQYLNQSQHWAEDMGQTAANERLQMFVIGADYDLQREKLFAALNSPGAGKLIHPYLGSMYIQVKDFSWTISTRKGGYCQIDLNYVRAGKRQYPIAKLTSKHQLEQSCDSSKAAVMKDFEAVFKLQRQAQFVQDAATSQLNQLTTAIRATGEQVQAVVQAAGNAVQTLTSTVQSAAELAQTPARILKTLDDQLYQAFQTTDNIDDLFSQYQQFSGELTTVAVVNKTDTPSRQQLAVNQNALNQSTQALACIRMALNISQLQTPFSTYSQAIAVRDFCLISWIR
ncbi:DNA circularization N-terminal domain-containing protein [Aliamphritea spongicola]|nr:DNA circularization N-terminal domain-containing protein [Aliamphritea spongicola]